MRARFELGTEVTTHDLHLSTDHAACSYGQAMPVVADTGDAVDRFQWRFFRVTDATDEEVAAFEAAGYPVTWADDARWCIRLASMGASQAANAAGRLAAQLEALAANREAEFAADDETRAGVAAEVAAAGVAVGEAWHALFEDVRQVQSFCAWPLVPEDDGPA